MRTYTKEERRQIAQAFRAAKGLLWDGIGPCPSAEKMAICFVLDESGHPFEEAAREVIAERLDGWITLGDWLREQGITEWTSQQLQAHRHAWLDKLIDEFES